MKVLLKFSITITNCDHWSIAGFPFYYTIHYLKPMDSFGTWRKFNIFFLFMQR